MSLVVTLGFSKQRLAKWSRLQNMCCSMGLERSELFSARPEQSGMFRANRTNLTVVPVPDTLSTSTYLHRKVCPSSRRHIALLLILYSLLAAAPCSLLRNETEDSAFPANSRALITRLISGIYCLEGGASPLGDFASQSHYPHAWERTPSQSRRLQAYYSSPCSIKQGKYIPGHRVGLLSDR
jgi:hypothetical protein